MSWTRVPQKATGDPLADHHGKPLISDVPSGEFVGRLVVELWRGGAGDEDADNVAHTIDTPGPDALDRHASQDAALRIARAAVERLERRRRR